ncbi:MAG TPA: TRAP transporter large permease subunit [Xanthobacteraceae bacterium]|nr:TRAP transporter large permease subunit [Xanthobacteraceae bacterium]
MSNPEIGMLMLALFLFAVMLGFPIAFTLAAMGLFFGYYAMGRPIFDLFVTSTNDVMASDVLTAVPLFLFMGYMVERANILDRLFYSVQMAARRLPGSLAVATLITCSLFATATGIVGAVVTLMGLLAFPAMLRAGYDHRLSAGVVCAGGCLGIMIPPSVLLILYGATAGISAVRLYAAAMIPGFLLTALYLAYVIGRVTLNPALAPRPPELEKPIPFFTVFWALLTSFFPLAILIMSVLGAILFGLATPSEAAAVGAIGAIVLAVAYGAFTFERLKEAVFLTARTSAMVCFLFVGSKLFSSVFAYLGGHAVVEKWFTEDLNLGTIGFMIVTQFIIFLLGWPLEWTEIIIIFVPIFLPLLKTFNVDPVLFGVLIALNMQTSFNTPPVAMAAYYLKGVAPPEVKLTDIFRGSLPFVYLVIVAMALIYIFPEIALWLPRKLYDN